MTPDPRETPQLPFRRLILMPWRWSRWAKWTCGMAFGFAPVFYYLSAVPVLWASVCLTNTRPTDDDWFDAVYAPVIWIISRSALSQIVLQRETERIESTVGWPDAAY